MDHQKHSSAETLYAAEVLLFHNIHCIATARHRHTKTDTDTGTHTHNTHSMRKQTGRDTDRTTHRKIGTDSAITDRSDQTLKKKKVGTLTDIDRYRHAHTQKHSLSCGSTNLIRIDYDICLECLEKQCVLA
jgi:hypothetical protein